MPVRCGDTGHWLAWAVAPRVAGGGEVAGYTCIIDTGTTATMVPFYTGPNLWIWDPGHPAGSWKAPAKLRP